MRKGQTATRHGMWGTPTYRSWANMLNRCLSPRFAEWRIRGEKVITVCGQWREFPNFLADMGEQPSGTSLKRINVNGNFEPQNCRWTKTHGLSAEWRRTRACWSNMIHRCTNPNSQAWKRYGGRGVRVCHRWSTFEHFLDDMGIRPAGLSIERIDNNGDYCPGNCKWASIQEQAVNRNVGPRRDGSPIKGSGRSGIYGIQLKGENSCIAHSFGCYRGHFRDVRSAAEVIWLAFIEEGATDAANSYLRSLPTFYDPASYGMESADATEAIR